MFVVYILQQTTEVGVFQRLSYLAHTVTLMVGEQVVGLMRHFLQIEVHRLIGYKLHRNQTEVHRQEFD
jgi:hypothetical protein